MSSFQVNGSPSMTPQQCIILYAVYMSVLVNGSASIDYRKTHVIFSDKWVTIYDSTGIHIYCIHVSSGEWVNLC